MCLLLPTPIGPIYSLQVSNSDWPFSQRWTSCLPKNLWIIVMTHPTCALTIRSFVWDLLGTCYVLGLVDTGDTRMNKLSLLKGAPHLGGKTEQTNVTSWLWPSKGRKIQSIIWKKKVILYQAYTTRVWGRGRQQNSYLLNLWVHYLLDKLLYLKSVLNEHLPLFPPKA